MSTSLRDLFYLKEGITFLNFGSFGACPSPIFEEYIRFQRELEAEPVQFITKYGLKYLAESRKSLAEYINCHMDDIALVTNPSYAVNTIARSLDLKPGDEILTTNIEYGACDRTWLFIAEKTGSSYICQPITLPIISKELFLEDFFKGFSAKTKLIFISHITSTTALILPMKEICDFGRENGVPVFIDGAHVPGHIDLDIEELGVDYYTGACHKWMMTPKGCSFMYVRRDLQAQIDPLVVSWGYNALFPSHSHYLDYHQMNGTRDYSALLCIPATIAFMEKHDWRTVASDCRKLVKDNATTILEILNAEPIAPINDQFYGQMYAARINTTTPEKLYRSIVDDYKIEIPMMRQEDDVYIRYSINGFNSQSDLDRLFEVLIHLKKKGEI
jgi:isopenicillin-N epimerase